MVGSSQCVFFSDFINVAWRNETSQRNSESSSELTPAHLIRSLPLFFPVEPDASVAYFLLLSLAFLDCPHPKPGPHVELAAVHPGGLSLLRAGRDALGSDGCARVAMAPRDVPATAEARFSQLGPAVA